MVRWAHGTLRQVLTATCWFDPGEDHGDQAGPFAVTIAFTGRRAGLDGEPGPGESFAWQETVRHVVAGSGPAAVTTQIRGISPGEWTVTARPVSPAGHPAVLACPPARCPPAQCPPARCPPARWPPAQWPPAQWPPAQWPLLARWASAAPVSGPSAITTTPPLAVRVPGTVRYGWIAAMLLGILAGLGIEAAVLASARIPAGGPLWISAVAIVAGLVGGKAWFIAVSRGRRFDGWCIQGGLSLGIAAAAACLLIAPPGLSAGTYLDAAAPGLLTGMAIGRLGCLLAGCCCGRPTASRWGVWSSDGRVGIRRIPVQLLEAALALACGLAALALVWAGPGRDGYVFAATLAAYTLGRQFLLALRAEPRRTRFRRPVTATVAALVLVAVILAAVTR